MPARPTSRKQIQNVKAHGVTPVVAINGFPTDHDSEHAAIRRVAEAMGARVAVCTHFADGGAGATDLAHAVVEACEEPSGFHFLYPDEASLKDKIEAVATNIYGAERVEYSPVANRQLANYTDNGFAHLPVCIAKTHLSISGDAVAEGGADRSHVERARGQGVRRRRLRVPDLRGDAHDARPRWPPGGGDHRLRRERRDRGAELMAVGAADASQLSSSSARRGARC